MTSIQILQMKSTHLVDLAFSITSNLTVSRSYLDRYVSLKDANSNIIMANNENYAVNISFNYHNVEKVAPILDHLEDTYPLDFSYYEEILNQANGIYQVTKFFDGLLENPFKNNSWEQFKPSSRKKSFCEDFSRNIKVMHTPAGSKQSKMIMKQRIAIAKIQLGANTYEYIPVVKFSLPMSRITSKTLFVSATSKYKFMCYIHAGKLIYVDSRNIDEFFKKHHTSIITYVYNNIAKHLGMMEMSLKEFKQLDVKERSDFILVANMMKM